MKIVVPKERNPTIPTIKRLIKQIAIFSRKACCTCLSVIPPNLERRKGGRNQVRVRDMITHQVSSISSVLIYLLRALGSVCVTFRITLFLRRRELCRFKVVFRPRIEVFRFNAEELLRRSEGYDCAVSSTAILTDLFRLMLGFLRESVPTASSPSSSDWNWRCSGTSCRRGRCTFRKIEGLRIIPLELK
jgi:hypothetical protein